MNHRLLTPAIVLVSFGAALGLTGPQVGSWHAAAGHDADRTTTLTAGVTPPPPAMLPPRAMTSTLIVMPEVEAEPVPTPAPAPAPAPAPEDDTPVVVTPEDQAQESEGFLDARDRAAERGARSH
jgi:hypothetical protein